MEKGCSLTLTSRGSVFQGSAVHINWTLSPLAWFNVNGWNRKVFVPDIRVWNPSSNSPSCLLLIVNNPHTHAFRNCFLWVCLAFVLSYLDCKHFRAGQLSHLWTKCWEPYIVAFSSARAWKNYHWRLPLDGKKGDSGGLHLLIWPMQEPDTVHPFGEEKGLVPHCRNISLKGVKEERGYVPQPCAQAHRAGGPHLGE